MKFNAYLAGPIFTYGDLLRNPEWEGAKALAKALKTENVMTIMSKRAVVDASIYIGKDFEQIVKPDQGETDDNQ